MKDHVTGPARQRGGFFIGLVVGLLVGLALSLGVALYVTKAPNPFVNKVPGRPAGQDAADAERNRNWDPNSSLAGRNPASAASQPGALAAPGLGNPSGGLVAPTVIDPVLPDAATAARLARPAASAASAGSGLAVAAQARASQVAVSSAAVGFDPFSYFVQAGAFARSEDAEQQRAKLALMGIESRLTEREQGGRMVYRVRVGPFDRKDEADAAKNKLGEGGIESALVRVQK